MESQLYESKSYPSQLTFYKYDSKEYSKSNKEWWSSQLQRKQMERLSQGLNKIDYEKLFANNGKNYFYFVANKMANKAVRLQFGLDRTYRKKEMNDAMLEFRSAVMENIIAGFIAKAKGEVKHVAPLIYDDLVARIVNKGD